MNNPDWNPLLQAAWRAWENAYAPYSGFCVGAAILLKNGTIVSGCNVENVAYPIALCAERTALCAAVAQAGLQPGQLSAIAVVTQATELTPICGACLQALVEFAENMPVLLANRHESRLFELKDLLPNAFSGRNLN